MTTDARAKKLSFVEARGLTRFKSKRRERRREARSGLIKLQTLHASRSPLWGFAPCMLSLLHPWKQHD
jgi:hypothetical protein